MEATGAQSRIRNTSRVLGILQGLPAAPLGSHRLRAAGEEEAARPTAAARVPPASSSTATIATTTGYLAAGKARATWVMMN